MATGASSHPRLARLIERCQAQGLTQRAEASLRELLTAHAAVAAAAKGSGRRRSTSRGSKAKGRAGVLAVKAWLLETFPTLAPDDIVIQTTSVGGSDLHFSPAACVKFPFAPEIKNAEGLNIWAALEQARLNAKKKGHPAVLFFRRNNTPLYVTFDAAVFQAWLRGIS